MPDHCVQNPAVGREARARARAPSSRPRPRSGSSSCGGGPAGLEAAWVAAARGHARRPAGAGRRARGRDPTGARSCRAGRRWRPSATGGRASASGGASTSEPASTPTADPCSALAPDAVVVATGGRADKRGRGQVPPDAGAGLGAGLGPRPHRGPPARARRPRARTRVVVLDAVGHIEAIGLGELLGRAGRRRRSA